MGLRIAFLGDIPQASVDHASFWKEILPVLFQVDAVITHPESGIGPQLESTLMGARIVSKPGTHLLPGTSFSFGLVSFTDTAPMGTGSEAVYIPMTLDAAEMAAVDRAVDGARAAGAGSVVFSCHCGPREGSQPRPLIRRFAQAVIERGADVFYGHGAHRLQGIEIFDGKPILFDPGELFEGEGAFLTVLEFEEGGRLAAIELAPLRVGPEGVRLAEGTECARLNAEMRRLSSELGTELEERGRVLAWRTEARPHREPEAVNPDHLASKPEEWPEEEDFRAPILEMPQSAGGSPDPERREDDESPPDRARVLRR